MLSVLQTYHYLRKLHCTYTQVVRSLFKKITNHQVLKKQPNCCAPAEYVTHKQDIEITKLRADTAGGCW
jgi:hypothetical protein